MRAVRAELKSERGGASIEFALVLPLTVSLLGVCLIAVLAVAQQVTLSALAAESARLLARGETVAVIDQLLSGAPGSSYTSTQMGELLCVTVRRTPKADPLAGLHLQLSATSCALSHNTASPRDPLANTAAPFDQLLDTLSPRDPLVNTAAPNATTNQTDYPPSPGCALIPLAFLRRLRDEEGSAVAMYGVCAAALIVSFAAINASLVVVEQVRLNGAADAAALAAADTALGLVSGTPCDRAGQVAAGNRATLERCTLDGYVAQVQVSVHAYGWLLRSTARAGPIDDPSAAQHAASLGAARASCRESVYGVA